MLRITILGVRGSVPVDGPEYQEFGGATTSILVETQDQAIYLDAGTGILRTPSIENKNISILLSHPHSDHLAGLSFLRYLSEKDRSITLYAKTRNGLNPQAHVYTLFSPPLWPLKIQQYPSDFHCQELPDILQIGDVRITNMETKHPGGSCVFRLDQRDSRGVRSLCFATDFEHDEDQIQALSKFAEGCDLLLYDAQYTDEEYSSHKGMGHSTPTVGLQLLEQTGAGGLLFIHHAPWHTDAILKEEEQKIKLRDPRAGFARSMQVITLE